MEPKNIEALSAYLAEHSLHYDISPVFKSNTGKPLPDNHVYDVNIEWGDWKHDHGYCDYLMSEIGYVKINEATTEENGSDCYSAIHRYAYKEWWERMKRVFEFLNNQHD